MSLFVFREIVTTGLHARTGNWSMTVGALRVTRIVDADLSRKFRNAPFVEAYVLTHEYAHAKFHHGLISLLLFPVARWLRPFFEQQADRYAVKQLGRRTVLRALMLLSTPTPTKEQARVYGATAAERAHRAGVTA